MTLELLTARRRDCLDRYAGLLVDRLGNDLVEIVVFGSVAPGESWPAGMRIPSDLAVFVRTRRELPAELRRISPTIVADPSEALAAAVATDGARIWPAA